MWIAGKVFLIFLFNYITIKKSMKKSNDLNFVKKKCNFLVLILPFLLIFF
jgi:hypothetical protein